MNLKYLMAVLMLFPAAQLSAQEAQEKAGLETQKERLSYGIGVNMGKSLKSLEVELDLELVIQALRDAYSDSQLLMSEEEILNVLTAYQKLRLEKQEEETRLLAEKNKREGDAFLAENRTKEGVVTLASGLQYKIIKAGEGNKPKDGDMIRVHYRGTLIDGTEFDSSLKREKPALFRLGSVIPGWTEALKLMPVGSKWQLFVPPDLAYGSRGTGRTIGPNATLIFEVELLAIEQLAKQESN